MLQMGIEPRTALATNMLALTFMSIGATVPFLKQHRINLNRLPLLIGLTLIASILGAGLLIIIPSEAVPEIVSFAMIGVVIFTVANRQSGVAAVNNKPGKISVILGYIVTFVLGIYGGFFSGGYVTLLTAAYVMLFRMTFVEAIATTKVINIFSSLVATIIFTITGIVNYPLGIILGITMFIGGMIGSQFALKINNFWLRRIFLVTVIILAVKTLISR